MAKRVKVKELRIVITSTSRKQRELERVIRTALEKYEGLAGVYDIDVEEINRVKLVERKEVKTNGRSKAKRTI